MVVMSARTVYVSVIEFFGGSFSYIKHFPDKMKVIPCKRMIKIHLNILIADIHHTSQERITVCIRHFKIASYLYAGIVKLPVHFESGPVNFYDIVLLV